MILYYCCAFVTGGILVSVLYQLNDPQPTRVDWVVWLTRVGVVCWLLLLMRCMRHRNLSDAVLAILLFAISVTEWTVFAMQLISTDFRLQDIVVDTFIAVSHTLVFPTLVGWDWLMVNDIAPVLYANTPKKGSSIGIDAAAAGDDDSNSRGVGHEDEQKQIGLPLRPLSDDIRIDSSVTSAWFCMGVRLGGDISLIRAIVHHWGATYVLLAVVRFVYEVGVFFRSIFFVN
ncbi:multidrug resistance-associated protein [Trypanosoma rangeli]|uniref:Multidrug resistance-associated protein n=1 Tax=Trypanosoma rangeli TaxID=5698 RepID=A0A422NXT9_TRYRA|nr:multidrug resistance-associated protein [Trypanosoma rangeli]RNF10352.1 multidrug resistance-associated protein [Trypanosoma rangeli]|eukprot:RNF10352.1 multidrug resistance-associated protein [Trypanosoma rangeli]